MLLFILVFLASGWSQTPPSGKLKDFLWQNDFREMIKKFGEENVTLLDKGDILQRIEARSYIEKPGIRVQVFARKDKDNAEKMLDQIRRLQLDSVYAKTENGLFKVQVGNYLERLEAEKMLDRLRFAGIENAWIVETSIHVPKTLVTETQPEFAQNMQRESKKLYYAVQLFVTNNPEKARVLQDKFSQTFSMEIWIKRQDAFWKVLAGKFENEETARQKLTEIKQAGYHDAWLTQITE